MSSLIEYLSLILLTTSFIIFCYTFEAAAGKGGNGGNGGTGRKTGKDSSNTGAIVGAVVGIVVLLLICFIIYFLLRKGSPLVCGRLNRLNHGMFIEFTQFSVWDARGLLEAEQKASQFLGI